MISGKDVARLELSIVKKTDIPWEISRSDGTVSENQHEVLCHWKCAFEKLLNPECGTFQIHGMSGPDRIYIYIYIEFIELNKQKKYIVQVYTSIYTKADGSPC